MDIVKLNFPTQIQPGELEGLLTLLCSIQAETQPINGHAEPGAIHDCWRTAIEISEKVRHIATSSIGDVLRERMDHYDKHGRSLVHDMEQNANGELVQAAIALASNNPSLMPSSWDDSEVIDKIFKKELYGRLTVACSFLIAHMDLIRIQNARGRGNMVFINGVNAQDLKVAKSDSNGG